MLLSCVGRPARHASEDMYKSGGLDAHPMTNEQRRAITEILTRSGGLFWGIVLLIVGLLWLLASLSVITLDLSVVWPLLVLLAGVYLVVTKLATYTRRE